MRQRADEDGDRTMIAELYESDFGLEPRLTIRGSSPASRPSVTTRQPT